ncbi:YIP1 family protein [Streptomyces sp. NBC_01255]|uniref:Yip1 family protein n=1 Tax=Streptomyces sp. NBC_01255 TaxID=2903798 RepID=UPI002E31AFC9|nr:Yip1 family protein [Streptomyces sp. NBC_01255]
MAGFRNGRGRDNRPPQQQQPQQAPYGYNAAPPPYPQQQWPPQSGQYGGQYGGQQGPQGGGQYGGGPQGQPQQQPYGEPEYFGDSYGQQQPPGQQAHAGTANNPGHTQMFSVDDPYGDGGGYQAAPPVPTGPRLPWKALLSGIVLRPADTFLRMRDHAVWGPALIVTFLYGLLAIFGFDKARDEAINATLSTAIPYVLMTALGFVVGGLILGAVTHTLARQLGGDGSWQPTVGLSMLIMSITDTPRLVFALFLGGENGFVQVVGWLTWLALGALLTVMVSRSHDLPWPKALGASAIQLVALLSLTKLGML